jgi:hypothetical protein
VGPKVGLEVETNTNARTSADNRTLVVRRAATVPELSLLFPVLGTGLSFVFS